MKPLALRTRLTAWYSCALGVIVTAFALVVLYQQGQIGLRRVDRQLRDSVGTVESLLRDELTETTDPAAAAREVVQTLEPTGRETTVLADGRLLASNAPDPGRTVAASHTLPLVDNGSAATATTDDGLFRLAARRLDIDGRRFDLLVASPLAETTRERREAQEAMWLGLPILMVLAVLGGFWLSAQALRPITDMARRAVALPVDGANDLGASGRDDELGQLERAFNGLLARLRASLTTQRRFMADASHELRTPVSVIRSVADVTLARADRSDAEYRDALSTVRLQSAQAGRLIDDMLLLARADAGAYPVAHEPFYLDEMLQSCAAAFKQMAAERGISIDVSVTGEALIVGDEQLLRRMVSNLVSNAVQHARPGGRVQLTLSVDDHDAAVRVRDDGPGIAPADRERIFERFVQLDPARRHDGAGLGLSISRWIADVHGGRLVVEDSSADGSVFLVRLPRGDVAAA